MTRLPAYQKRNKSARINCLGLPRLPAWVSNGVKKPVAKWTAHAQPNISAFPSASAPMTTHMEQVKTPGSALNRMQSQLLPTVERVQRQQNAPHLHHSPRACPPPPVLRLTRSCSPPLRLV